jgi:hypothetical protein
MMVKVRSETPHAPQRSTELLQRGAWYLHVGDTIRISTGDETWTRRPGSHAVRIGASRQRRKQSAFHSGRGAADSVRDRFSGSWTGEGG